MSIAKRVGQNLAPKVTQVAPQITAGFVQQALDRAIRGVGPLDGAAMAAEKQLDEQKGDVDKAIKEIIENHVRLAGAQGFLTNIGGLVDDGGRGARQHRRAGADPVPDGGRRSLHLRGYDLDGPARPQRDPGQPARRGADARA